MLNYTNPETTTEHVRDLNDDFNAISVILEADPAAQVSRHFPDTIYRSYLELGRLAEVNIKTLRI